MKTESKPLKLWAVWGNGYGLRGPAQVTWDEKLKSWWDKSKDNEIKELGLVWTNGDLCFTFASKSLEEVRIFVDGYKTCAKIVKNATQITPIL